MRSQSRDARALTGARPCGLLTKPLVVSPVIGVRPACFHAEEHRDTFAELLGIVLGQNNVSHMLGSFLFKALALVSTISSVMELSELRKGFASCGLVDVN